MRYPPDHKRQTKKALLEAAAEALRREGPHRLGVARVMADAGLTHGGFYAHFPSRDALIAAGIGQMFEESRDRLPAVSPDRSAADNLARFIDQYLSTQHRDARGGGCPLPFLANDAPRLSAAARQQFARGVRGLTDRFAALLSGIGQPEPEAEAASALSEMVGALTFARAEPDPDRSNRILEISRSRLRKRFGLETRS